MHHAQGFIYTLCTSRLSGRGLILRPLLLHAVLELLHHLHTHGTALRRTHHAAPRHKAATKLPQRPFARVLSLAHLGARPEVAVRLKRQAVFHGPVLFLAARPPDNAVHDLPAPDEPVQLPLARVQLRASGVSLTSSSSGGPDMMSGAQAVCTGGKNTQHTSLSEFYFKDTC